MNTPLLIEINTRCWLTELGARHGASMGLGEVPDSELTRWRDLGFTHVWLMGVWSTDPASRQQCLGDSDLLNRVNAVLPDWAPEDLAGSPYAIGEHRVAPELGGEEGLSKLRRRLHGHGLKLILDFVPNHTGLSHPWLDDHPELYVSTPPGADQAFQHAGDGGVRWIAHGKDPHFPAWRDTAQLDFRREETHQAVLECLQQVAERCDGVRCDMAMLVLRDVFEQTWPPAPSANPPCERQFWSMAIPEVKHRHPDFLFLAEVYWDLEKTLQSLGFDYTYDKWLYDHLRNANGAEACHQLRQAGREFLDRSLTFLENHDEARAASLFAPPEYRAALVLFIGLPGMRMFHDGQIEGRRIRLPVQLRRRPVEPVDTEIQAYIEWLLRILRNTGIGHGDWKLLKSFPAWSTNQTSEHIVITQWQCAPDRFELVVVNTSAEESQCFVHPEMPGLASTDWKMTDLIGEQDYVREGRDMANRGLYLALEPHGAHVFHLRPVDS